MRRFAFIWILILSPCVIGQAIDVEAGWKGILPLRSSKADVEKAFGPPSRIDEAGWYEYVGETVVLRAKYATKPCTRDQFDRGRYRIRKESVLELSVRMTKSGIPIADVVFDRKRFMRLARPHNGITAYWNQEFGISIEASEPDAAGVEYFGRVHYEVPPEVATDLKCPKINP